jgi:Mg/Co/Ni transporter MgtE
VVRGEALFTIKDMLSGNYYSYPEDIQEYMKSYNEKLRELIIRELINDTADRMLRNIDKSRKDFMNILSDILENGCKGFNSMSTQNLLNIYLERKDEEAFAELLDTVNRELDEN